MNKLDVVRQVAVAMVVGFVAFAASVAQADNSYLENFDYEDEIHRCIDILRPAVAAGATDKVTYDIQDIDLRGPWYRFEIAVTVKDADGETVVDGYRVGCKSNRHIEAARLLERRNKQDLPVRIERFASYQ